MGTGKLDASGKASGAEFPIPGCSPDLHQDACIQAEVWLALWQANDMNALDISAIDVIVRQCEVWLSGNVDDAQAIQLAEYLVKGINQVRSCHNELKVESGKTASS